MTSFYVNLSSINSVKEFCKVASDAPCKVTLTSDIYVVDGKSIMGIFSLDLAKPVNAVIDTDDQAIIDRFKSFIVDCPNPEA